jgi:DNA-binding transcriptional ArsR family regulator
MARREAERRRDKKAPAAALSHPLRVRILEVLNERDMSPTDFVAAGLVDDFSDDGSLSKVSYHFRELAAMECLEVVKVTPVRGAIEKTYRGTASAYHTTADFAALTFEQRKRISRTTMLSLSARAESAIMSGHFDRRPDRHQSWLMMDVDEDGWTELMEILAYALSEAERIKAESAERTAADPTRCSFRATFGAMGFESPPPIPPVDH